MKILWVFELQPTERVQVSVQPQDQDDDDDDDDGDDDDDDDGDGDDGDGDDETHPCLDTQPLDTQDDWWKRCVSECRWGADGCCRRRFIWIFSVRTDEINPTLYPLGQISEMYQRAGLWGELT